MSKKTRSSRKKARPILEEGPRKALVRIHNIDMIQSRFFGEIDPIHHKVDWFSQELVQDVWRDKYAWTAAEETPRHTFMRVAMDIYKYDSKENAQEAFECMDAGLWMPGGRIIAGAGTTKRVTLMNCYVNRKMEDSLDDIMAAVRDAALTQQMGGGIGTDFSTLRPTGALLRRTGAAASGPLPFMDMWHAMCDTIMSAGDRRGAMMGTLCDTHPDLPKFITAKQQKGRLKNFNVSVLVSDAFVEAAKEDEEWLLYFHVEPRYREPHLVEYDFIDEKGTQQYVYSVWRARELWELILRNTYDWSEPGVIFIDRINDLNNLKYCEEIRCTNPCGEQPLPPNATCNLGAINLARIVQDPFDPEAKINWKLLSRVAKIGMRFLDNVIDVTQYPLKEQAEEEYSKRRTGLGVSGLANCLAQLGLRYGSADAVRVTEQIFRHIALAAYEQSMELAEDRGPFPFFDAHKFLDNTWAGANLSDEYKHRIKEWGIRNGVLLTVAPTGTTSILYGNISSGIEPVFAQSMDRNVRQRDDTFRKYTAYDYNVLLYHAVKGAPIGTLELPPYMVVADDLSIEDHVATQAAVQRWVDASVSKTINVSQKTSYEQFRKVYDLAYTLGCKGCTTYRPSDVRGSILTTASSAPSLATGNGVPLSKRTEVLAGSTHQIRWPSMSAALYLTINQDQEGNPFEVFFNSKDARYQEWMTALSLMITAILRKGDDPAFIASELQQVHSVHDTAWIKTGEKSQHFPSLIAYVGYTLEKYFGSLRGRPQGISDQTIQKIIDIESSTKEKCPACFQPSVIRKEGCKTCLNCGHSDCA